METASTSPTGTPSVIQPDKGVPRKYLVPILYLADGMATADRDVVAKERAVIDDLAEAANLKNFRHLKEFSILSQDSACRALDIEVAKRAALVLMSLVLKMDGKRLPEEHEFFNKIRIKLQASPVTVPVDLEAHRQLAFKYMAK